MPKQRKSVRTKSRKPSDFESMINGLDARKFSTRGRAALESMRANPRVANMAVPSLREIVRSVMAGAKGEAKITAPAAAVSQLNTVRTNYNQYRATQGKQTSRPAPKKAPAKKPPTAMAQAKESDRRKILAKRVTGKPSVARRPKRR